jgi:hypothetical protein
MSGARQILRQPPVPERELTACGPLDARSVRLPNVELTLSSGSLGRSLTRGSQQLRHADVDCPKFVEALCIKSSSHNRARSLKNLRPDPQDRPT